MKFKLEEIEEELAADDNSGRCIECGAVAEQPCEPDARKYKCSACGQDAVYGLQEIVLMGLVE
jgi:hypothetical protein